MKMTNEERKTILNGIVSIINDISNMSHWERPFGITDYDIERMRCALEETIKEK